MDWRLLVKIVVDGTDLSSRFRPLLSSVEISDGVGLESDELLIALATGSLIGQMPFPRAGAEIEVYLGSGVSAARMGLFIADEFEASGPPDVMRISAKAAVYSDGGGKTGLQDAKTRSWEEGTTIGEMTEKIAGEHGLGSAVSASVRDIALSHIDQIAESDMNLLTRVAREHDAVAKPGNGQLVVARRGESQSASGAALPVVSLRRSQIGHWSLLRTARDVPESVVAVWRDLLSSEDREARAGSGSPEVRLRTRFQLEEQAIRAAEAALARGKRGELSLHLDVPGRADIVAEGRVVVSGLHPDADGEWLVSEVRHRVSGSGWATSVSCEVIPSN
jgi:phage protein D